MTTVGGQILNAEVQLSREFIDDAAVNVAKFAADRLDGIIQREINKRCRCVEHCAEDPATACSLSGQPHVHPNDNTDTFGRCPMHPDVPGDV